MIKDKKVKTMVFVQAIVRTLTGQFAWTESHTDSIPLFYWYRLLFYVLEHMRSLFAYLPVAIPFGYMN